MKSISVGMPAPTGRSNWALTLFTVGLLMGLAGCGQKGPLKPPAIAPVALTAAALPGTA